MRRPPPGPHRPTVAVSVAIAVLVALAVLATGVVPAEAEAPGPYTPPVDAPVVDEFRSPDNPYAAGNRGLDYEVPDGSDVRAAGPGEVTFAGPVGGELHVVVLHPDGLRTSYSFLREVLVRRGDRVEREQVVGRSGRSLHFGVRAGGRYVDPALLFAGASIEVHLIPVEDRSPRSVEVERRWLRAAVAGVRALGDVGEAVVSWLADEAAVVATSAGRLSRPALLSRTLADGARAWRLLLAGQRRCTPSGTPAPAPPDERRIVVLVGGYGSAGGHADVLGVDTTSLGYDDADRVQFSYAGGRVPRVGALGGVPVRSYDGATSMGDLRQAGRRLRSLLVDIEAAHPGVPVDVIAHSQGGLVARAALVGNADAHGVEQLVTLGTPHHGAPLATLAEGLGITDGDGVLDDGLSAVSGGAVDPSAPAVAQLVEGSAFLDELAARPLPPGVSVTSIAAAGDLVVPATSSALARATNVMVPLGGPAAHGRLPGSPEVTDVLGRALARQGPPCTSPAVLAGLVGTATAIAGVQHAVGDAAGPAVPLVGGLTGVATGELATAGG